MAVTPSGDVLYRVLRDFGGPTAIALAILWLGVGQLMPRIDHGIEIADEVHSLMSVEISQHTQLLQVCGPARTFP